MKKLIFIIMILGFVTQIEAQRKFADPSVYDSVSSVNYNSTFMIRQGGVSKTLTWYRLNQLLTSGDELLADDNTWTGANNFTSEVQLPSSLAATLSNGVGYNSGLFSWVESGAVKTGADRAWVLQQIADSGYAVDTNNFAILSGDNVFTGNNTLSGANTFTSALIGSGNNSGTFKIPVYTTSVPSLSLGSTFYNSSTDRIRVYDGGWKTFLDSTATVSLIQTGSYLQTSGTQTGLSSSLTWSSGTIIPATLSFGTDTGKDFILPLDDTTSTQVVASEGSMYWEKNAHYIMAYDGSDWAKFAPLSYVNSANAKGGVPFFISYPQTNDYLDFNLPYDVTIDSIWVDIGTDGGSNDSIAYNIWWDDYYVNGVASSYLFASTKYTDAVDTGVPDKYYRSGLGTPVFDGNDTTIGAGEKFWLQISTVTGTIKKISLTVFWTKIYAVN